MTRRIRAPSFDTVVNPKAVEQRSHCRRLVSQVKARWYAGEPVDVQQALAQYPELQRHKSIVVDLAYEEYCQAEEAGDGVKLEAFLDRFPQYQTSLRRRLEVHQYLKENTDVAPLVPEFPNPGDEFCGFELVDEIGRGAIGCVYLAKEKRLGDRLVVVKVSPEGGDEANMLGKLKHAHVVPVYSIQPDVATGLTAVCMPYLGRATLEDVLDENHSCPARPGQGAVYLQVLKQINSDLQSDLAPEIARPLSRWSYFDATLFQISTVAEALAHTHAQGIYHRDLKPSNILLAADGRLMLLDFNLSEAVDSSSRRLGGTLPYMSPEQLRMMLSVNGEASDLDGRSDIFSSGVILYQCLTGAMPFGEISTKVPFREAARLLLKRQEDGPDLQRLKPAGCDRNVVAILHKCLAVDPQQRYQTAGDLAGALRSAVNVRRRARRWALLHPWTTLLTTIALVLALVAGSYFVITRPPLHERLLAAGVALYEQGDLRGALEQFRLAADGAPDWVTPRIAMARVRQFLEEYPAASEEFGRASKMTNDPQWLANAGYCCERGGDLAKAEYFYREAITRGYKPCVVLNNLGFLLRRRTGFDEAEKLLSQAIQQDPKYQAALYNRALAVFQRSAYRNTSVPDQAIDDIESAIRIGPVDMNMHYAAARIWVLSERNEKSSVTLKHLEKAILLGYDPKLLQSVNEFRPLLKAESIQNLLKRTDIQRAAHVPMHLDPWSSEHDLLP